MATVDSFERWVNDVVDPALEQVDRRSLLPQFEARARLLLAGDLTANQRALLEAFIGEGRL